MSNNCCWLRTCYICLRYLFWIGVDDANCGVHLPEVDEGTGVEDLACCWCWKDCWNELNCWLMTDCCLWRLPPPKPPPPPFRRFLRRRRLFAKSHSFFKQFINKRALRPLRSSLVPFCSIRFNMNFHSTRLWLFWEDYWWPEIITWNNYLNRHPSWLAVGVKLISGLNFLRCYRCCRPALET